MRGEPRSPASRDRRARGDPDAAAPATLAPRANPDLVGHEAAERALRRFYDQDRLPHALLLCGPRGIGKATLAFRFARFLLARPGPAEAGEGLAVDSASGAFRRVAAGGHADLLTVERAWDPRRQRLRGEILVDDAREIALFLHLTPAEEGWRIVVVDGAEEMNTSAANALLKILEEPPQRSLLLLVSHNPGRLLPTIRSRCRRFVLAAPEPGLVRQLILRHRPELDASEAAALAELAEGSVGRALELADAGGLALYRSLVEILASLPAVDLPALHAFADRLARPEAEEGFRTAADLLGQFLARLAAGAARREAAAFDAEIVAG
ncbi:MAG TPA: DNA polymerase III subunit delta', partial [Stellaceae bacterium]|nr:DNA polymerase III subunit delta' [Stellaceae bacterium]